jgi:solute carrier family 12 sodium/potassium/chloride transporter 2
MPQAVAEHEQPTARFGTFTGVFTPTLLTILGVIMYVRIGWVVGNAGLGGALIILGVGILITACTGLSLSSIATNTRIGPGGPYAIMNRSLGLEVGGAIGIPLYLTRPLGVAMYIFGFREGLLWVVPQLSPLLVDLGVFALLFGIAFKSADLAFKTQYFIMGAIALSLVSIFASPAPFQEPVPIEWWGDYPGDPETGFHGADFWMVFAVFFPATTGILAGANMSGDLKDPRRAIPVGTMWAIALSSIIYVAVAVWAARTGTLDELSGNYTHVIDKSFFPPLVLIGLLGATASSALAGLVGGPRILMAMGQNRIVPFSDQLARIDGGEPRNALLVTGVLTLACVMVRDLNAIAPVVTMFFLITYCMINVVVLVEGKLGLVSYRPTLKVPLIVPLVGLVGCLVSMFIIAPVVSLISIAVVVALYVFIGRRTRGDERVKEDVRSSIFTGFAEWAAAHVTPEDMDNVRAWKPHFVVPVRDPENLRGSYSLLMELLLPEGTVKLLGLSPPMNARELGSRLERIGRTMRENKALASWTVVNIPENSFRFEAALMALQGAFFKPNLVFARLLEGEIRPELARAVRTALDIPMGVVLYGSHPTAGLGRRRDIHVFVRHPQGSWDAHDAFGRGNLNMLLLMGFRLWRRWGGRMSLITVVRDPADEESARRFLHQLCDLARFPRSVRRVVAVGDLAGAIRGAPVADLCLFGLDREQLDFGWCDEMVTLTRSSCLFVLDSGRESARA